MSEVFWGEEEFSFTTSNKNEWEADLEHFIYFNATLTEFLLCFWHCATLRTKSYPISLLNLSVFVAIGSAPLAGMGRAMCRPGQSHSSAKGPVLWQCELLSTASVPVDTQGPCLQWTLTSSLLVPEETWNCLPIVLALCLPILLLNIMKLERPTWAILCIFIHPKKVWKPHWFPKTSVNYT